MSQPIINLRSLRRTDLPAITPWFEDPDTAGISEARAGPRLDDPTMRALAAPLAP